MNLNSEFSTRIQILDEGGFLVALEACTCKLGYQYRCRGHHASSPLLPFLPALAELAAVAAAAAVAALRQGLRRVVLPNPQSLFAAS